MIKEVNRLNASHISYTIKQISKMVDNDKISFNNIVQRSYVWEVSRRSEFIWSLIMNYPIPPIYSGRDISDENKVLDIMDGQQRITTIHDFLNDGFALSELKAIPYIDENNEEKKVDISGKVFSELDEEIQDLIRDRTFTMYYYDNITQKEKAEMFKRLNNGKPLTAKNKALASCKGLEELVQIGSDVIFNDMLTDKARANKNQAIITMKAWTMLNKDIDDISFESRIFNPMLEEVEIADSEAEVLFRVYSLMRKTHDILTDWKEKKTAKKLYTETHFVSLIPFFKESLQRKYDGKIMAGWIMDFFGNEGKGSRSEMYNDAAGSGSAKNTNIQRRHTALKNSYEKYFTYERYFTEELPLEDEEENNTVENIEQEEKDFSTEVDEVLEYIEEANEESFDENNDNEEFVDITDEILADLEVA